MKMKGNFISLIGVLFILLAGMAMTGCAPLFSAAGSGDINAVKDLLDKGANVNEWMAGTPLWSASAAGHTDVVKLLIERGADVNMMNRSGDSSALVLAAANAHTNIVKILIENGADIDEAIAGLEKRAAFFSEFPAMPTEVAKAKSGIKLIERIVRKQEIASQPVIAAPKPSQNLNKEDMEKIVQAAVEKAAKPKEKEARPVSAGQTDIDKPSFAITERIFGDNDIAVVIGIEGYQNLPKSDFSYDDAKLVKEYIKALGFKERNIELITDEKATKSSIEKSLEAWLKNKAKADSKVFVYYSGHGAPNPKTGDAFLVPYDGDPAFIDQTGYSLKRLYENLGKLQVKEIIVVLDSCFSGAGGRSVIAKGAKPLVMNLGNDITPVKNMTVLSASSGDQISSAYEEKGHGLFTYFMLKGIKDGITEIGELFDYMKPQVERVARKTYNNEQSPQLIAPEKKKVFLIEKEKGK